MRTRKILNQDKVFVSSCLYPSFLRLAIPNELKSNSCRILLVIFRNCLTLIQAGFFIQVLTIVSVVAGLWERWYIARKNEGFFIYAIRKWLIRFGLKSISDKPSNEIYSNFKNSLIVIGVLSFLIGVSLQLAGTFIY